MEPVKLDLKHPLKSLREASGCGTQYQAAIQRGITYAAQFTCEQRLSGVRLITLMNAAKAFGGRLELYFIPEPEQAKSKRSRKKTVTPDE
jgi:predicted ABC-type ATPase